MRVCVCVCVCVPVCVTQALLDAAVASGNDALQETSAVAIKASTLGTVLSALKSHTSDTSDKGTTDTALIQVGTGTRLQLHVNSQT